MIKQWPKQKEKLSYCPSVLKILLAKALDMRQKHTTMVLPLKIKLKKDCTKNASVVRLCSISEVVKPSSKMALLYSKIAAMWHVQEKSPIHYFGSFLIQRNLKET